MEKDKTGWYYLDKLMKMPDEFRDACRREQWPAAKHTYDRACMYAAFMEVSSDIRQDLFGYTDSSGTAHQGRIPAEDAALAINRCIIKNGMGFGCTVYRIPEESFCGERLLQAPECREKYYDLPDQFLAAVRKKEWAGALYLCGLMDSLAVFLEIPFEERQKIWGYEDDEGQWQPGRISKETYRKAMNKCLIENRLGFDRLAYRIPGEAGYWGAHPIPGEDFWQMTAEDNPSYWAGTGWRGAGRKGA